YRHFGHDIAEEDTPIEAGLGFAVAYDKGVDFIGRDALLKQKAKGTLTKRMVQLALEDPEPLLYHNEPIYLDGKLAGYTSSAKYGHHFGRAIATGYVHHPDGVTADPIQNAKLKLEVAGERRAARATLRLTYAPTSERMKV